jgi:membrane protease YdiL (CAAX protease family)
MKQSLRVAVAFVVLFVLYQSAEGVGGRLLDNFAVQAGLMLACVIAAWPLSRWLGHRGLGAWALEATPRALAWLAAGLAIALLAKGAALWLGLRAGIYAAPPAAAPSPGTPLPFAGLLPALPMLLLSTFVPSIAEDILTRGFWYRAAGIAWRRGIAFVAFSTAMYVLNHVYRLGNGPGEWLMLACFGIAYATALWRTGTLWAAVGLHWGWNLANAVSGQWLPVEVANPQLAPMLSAAMHLAMAGTMLLATTRIGRAPTTNAVAASLD